MSQSLKTFNQGAQLITQLEYVAPAKNGEMKLPPKDTRKESVEGVRKDKEWEDVTYLLALKNTAEELQKKEKAKQQKVAMKTYLDSQIRDKKVKQLESRERK